MWFWYRSIFIKAQRGTLKMDSRIFPSIEILLLIQEFSCNNVLNATSQSMKISVILSVICVSRNWSKSHKEVTTKSSSYNLREPESGWNYWEKTNLIIMIKLIMGSAHWAPGIVVFHTSDGLLNHGNFLLIVWIEMKSKIPFLFRL